MVLRCALNHLPTSTYSDHVVTGCSRLLKRQPDSPEILETNIHTCFRAQASLPAVRSRPHLLCEDLSYGKETVRIPVFNEVNDSRELPQLEYHADYVWAAGIQEMVCLAAAHQSLWSF